MNAPGFDVIARHADAVTRRASLLALGGAILAAAPAPRTRPLSCKVGAPTRRHTSANVSATRLSPQRPASFGLAALSSISSLRTL